MSMSGTLALMVTCMLTADIDLMNPTSLVSGGHLLASVQTLVTTIIFFFLENASRVQQGYSRDI